MSSNNKKFPLTKPSSPKLATIMDNKRYEEVKCPTCTAFFRKDVVQEHEDVCAEGRSILNVIEIQDDTDCTVENGNSLP